MTRSIRFHHDVQDIELPAPIALLVFHIAREGIMNAFKHADPTDVWVGRADSGEDIVLPAARQRFGVRCGRARPRGSLRDGDDARACAGRWW